MLLGGSLDMAWVVRFVHQPHLVEEGEKTGECTTGMHSTLFVTLPWLVCEPLCLWTGSVNMAISTFETLPVTECHWGQKRRDSRFKRRTVIQCLLDGRSAEE